MSSDNETNFIKHQNNRIMTKIYTQAYQIIKNLYTISLTFFTLSAKKLSFVFALTTLSLFWTTSCLAQSVLNVQTGTTYSNIVAAHDAATTLDGHTLRMQPANGSFDYDILSTSESNAPEIEKSLTIDGQNCTITSTCNGAGDQIYAFLLNAGSANEITLKNMTLCNFCGNDGAAIKDHHQSGAFVTLDNVVVTNSINSAYAVHIENFAHIENCSFSNQTGNTGGLNVNVVNGAGACSGCAGLTVDIINSSFDCNKHAADNGASVRLGQQGSSTAYLNTINITGGSISNNENKAALYLNMGKSSVVNITGTAFNNNATAAEASAIYMARYSGPNQWLYLTDCNFTGNKFTGGTDDEIIKGGISSDYTVATNCVFIKGDGNSDVIDENASGSIQNSTLSSDITIGSAQASNTIISPTGSPTATDNGSYYTPGMTPGTCSTSGCLPSSGPGTGAEITFSDCLVPGTTLSSTMSGVWKYQQPGGSVVTLPASTTMTIPAGLSGYTVFWQEVASGTDPVLAGDVGANPGINTPEELVCYGSISGTVFQDGDATAGSADGAFGADDLALGGETVELLDAGGNVIATTMTDADGNYEFYNIPSGNYSVQFTIPASLFGSTFSDSGTTSTDSDIPETIGGGIPVSTGIISIDLSGDLSSNSYDDSFGGAGHYVGVGAGFVADGGALPVELISFTGQTVNCLTELRWETASEINNYFFEVERSEDGRNFKSVAVLYGAGTTDIVQVYQYTDEPLVSKRTTYYRLKQVDYDASYAYSNVVSVKGESCEADVTISSAYPNPFNGALTFEINNSFNGTDGVLEIYNVIGHKVLSYQIEIAAGQSTFVANTDGLAPGTYFARLIGSGYEITTAKLLKIK